MTGQEEEQSEGTGQNRRKNSQKEQDRTGGRTVRRNRTEQEEEQSEGTGQNRRKNSQKEQNRTYQEEEQTV